MHRALTASATVLLGIEQPLLALKMIGQRAAPGLRRFGITGFHPAGGKLGHVGIEFLQRERQLVRIEPFRPSAILRALQLFDDLPKPFDLSVAGLYPGCHVAHQPVQKRGIMRQIIEIEPHARLYTGWTLNPSCSAALRLFLPCCGRSPDTLRHPQVDTLDQQRQLG